MTWEHDQVERIHNRYRAEFDAVRRDTSRTAEWQKRQLADAWLQMTDEVNQQREQASAASEAHTRSLTRQAFGVEGISGDPGSLTISARDASDRVAQTDTRHELEHLLDSASSTGDEVLARAVARRAFEYGDNDLLDRFLSIRPELQPTVTELRGMTTDTRRTRITESLNGAAAKPPELRGMDEFTCRRLLADTQEQHSS